MLRRRQPDFHLEPNSNDGDEQKRRRPLSVSLSLFLLIIVCTTIFLITNFSMQRPRLHSAASLVYSDEDAPFKSEPAAEYRNRIRKQMRRTIPDTIFVSMASYRDDACPETLSDLFSKAAHPDKITVGLVDQTNMDDPDTDDIHCDALLTATQKKQVRIVRMRHKNARGPTYARYLASKLWENEQYFMQIDAHSQFAQDWDQMLIDNLKALPDPDRYIITHYPPGEPSELTPESPVTWICAAEDHEQAPLGLFVQAQDVCWQMNQSPDLTPGTCVSPFMGGGLFFGSAGLLIDAPYDKYLDYLFHGEEVLIAARLWTRGYTLVTPRRNVLSHTYGGRDKNVYGDGIDVQAARRSEARVRLLLEALVDKDGDRSKIPADEVDQLGMGSVRSIDEYKRFAGIHLMGDKTFFSRCKQRYQDGQWVDVNPKSEVEESPGNVEEGEGGQVDAVQEADHPDGNQAVEINADEIQQASEEDPDDGEQDGNNDSGDSQQNGGNNADGQQNEDNASGDGQQDEGNSSNDTDQSSEDNSGEVNDEQL